jgi:proteasome lid subunit RPN8/RPN11
MSAQLDPYRGGKLYTDEQLYVPRRALRNIRAHALEYVPNEACGFLGGNDANLRLLMRCPNRSPTPASHWYIDPLTHYQAEVEFATRQAKIRAIYHSHPRSSARPSQSDLAGTPNDWYMLIYSIPDDEVLAWLGNKPVSIEVND